MHVLKFILSVTKPFRWHLYGMVLVILINSVDTNLRPYIIKLLIDSATGNNFITMRNLAIAYAILQVIIVLSWTFNDWCVTKFYAKFRMHIASNLASKLSYYSYTFFQDNLAGSLTSKINDAFNQIPNIWFTINYQFISFSLSAIFTFVLLAKIHIFFAVGLFVWMFIFLLITYFGLQKALPLTKDYAESKSVIWGHLSDFLTNMLGVRLFAASKFEMEHLKAQSIDFINKSEKHGNFLMVFYTVQGLISSVYTFLFLFLLVDLKKKGLIGSGDLALIFMLNYGMVGKLFDLSHQLRDFINNWGTVDQALTILDVIPEIQDIPNAEAINVNKGEIKFENVGFHYKGVTPLFNNLSISISSGQKVGLVGYSGSGKTTFVNLILRLYDVDSGQILIDNQNIKNITQESLRKNIGMIPQDPALFHRTLTENIRYGRLEATDEEVIEAAKRAHAHEFINGLPEKYNSLVGERGIKLSGGQRQRIAIARAIIKDAPILILDEATSQLDSLTENYIQESMWHLMQNKTTIIVAHRLSTLLRMDRILVFDKGRIIEEGTHEELITKNGLYKTLWLTQVEGFLPENNN